MTDKENQRTYAGKTLSFAELVAEEAATITGKENELSATASFTTARATEEETKPLVGLALSGGGIRSAAFSLGLLQGLKANDAFESLDYLSTVSGGGYTGAALIAGMERSEGEFPFLGDKRSPPGSVASDIADTPAVWQLRDRSRYLMPDGPFDLVVSLGIILRGLAVNATFVAAGIFFLAGLTLLANPDDRSLATSWVNAGIGQKLVVHLGPNFVVTKVASLLFLIWLVGWAAHRSLQPSYRTSTDTGSDPDSWPAKATAVGMVLIAALFTLEMQTPVLRWALALRGDPKGASLPMHRLPELIGSLAAGTGVFALTWRWLVSQAQEAAKDPAWKAMMRLAASKISLFALSLALPLLIYLLFIRLTVAGIKVGDHYPNGLSLLMWMSNFSPAMLIGLFWVSCLNIWLVIWVSSIGPIRDTWALAAKGRWKELNKPNRLNTVALFVIPIAALALPYGVSPAMNAFLQPLAMPLVYLLIGGFLTTISSLFSENATSLHRLYRDRLNEAFALGECNRAYRLSELSAPFSAGKARRPYLIVNTAVNLQGSKTKKRRGRKSDFFVFTPGYVGSDATGYVKTEQFQEAEPQIDLATAAAISGAAVSPAMGRVGVPLLGPTLALLNIRLGYWVRNPALLHSPSMAKTAALKDWKLLFLVDEMFGWLTEDRSKVLLSDGGHIDNLGLYQLLKRRCDLIVVSDAEADPAMNFSSLIDIERFARIDLGVRFDLPWQPIRDNALARQRAIANGDRSTSSSPVSSHAAVGTIYYPAVPASAHSPALSAKKGTMLYIKSSVSGDERSYILDYERRFPRFPHEPTSDQFFGEEQFEVYRALGFHAIDRALTVPSDTANGGALMESVGKALRSRPAQQPTTQ